MSSSSSGHAAHPPAAPGDALADVDTPALVLDLDAFEANLAAVHGHARANGVRVRAHGKAHRCPEIACRQLAAGAVGVCCQKVGEAEGFAAAGIDDILVSNEIVGAAKLARLARLARSVRLAVCVDHPDAVTALAQACVAEGSRLDVLIEVDVGQGRCGVASVDEALALARALAAAPRLRLRGLQAYHGGAQHLRTAGERAAAFGETMRRAARVRDTLRSAGFRCEEVSGGGTGTFIHEAASGIYTEIQPGSYVLMDLDYRANQADAAAPALRQAIGVLATVMSVRDAHVVLDAGLKALALDSGPPAMRLPGWAVRTVSDEHTVVDRGPGTPALSLGARCLLDPGHCDPTMALHDWVVACRTNRVEAVWPVLPRGASR
ncbi:MAG: DSD1 family PLP-dependent enzyme [Burkholderiales bacterium]|nr:DSD1 family PLP-dependent enzyme [Burkholderiales bacterium]OJX03802.1 MAG: hypothetical protein BGO72_02235 [Burkholderiales bacterium 70-64]